MTDLRTLHMAPLPERQRAEHMLHLQVMAAQCRHAARCLPHKPSREAAQRNLETIEWALAQLKAPKPKAKPKVVVEPPPDDLWDRIDPGTGAA